MNCNFTHDFNKKEIYHKVNLNMPILNTQDEMENKC